MKFYYITGLIIAIIPSLGFPNGWENGIIFVLGLAIFFKAFSSERANKKELSLGGETFSQKEPKKKEERFDLEDVVEEIEEELEDFAENDSDTEDKD